MKRKPINDFTVFDSSEEKQLYHLRISAIRIDTITHVNYSTKSIITNPDNKRINDIFNVTLSIYNNKLNKWINLTIKRFSRSFAAEIHRIEWNNRILIIKCKFYTKTIKMYNERSEKLIAQFRHRTQRFNKLKYKYNLKIYSNKLPDVIYLLALTIMYHKDSIKISKY